MNARTVAIAAIASITTVLVAGCSAAPDPSTEEGTTSTDQALPKGGGGGPPPPPRAPICGPQLDLSGTFEQGLAAFGCGQKQMYSSNDATDVNYFRVWCPPTNAPSPAWAAMCPDWSTRTSLVGFINCWANTPPYKPVYDYNWPKCGNYWPPGQVQILFDPHCHGGGCSAPT